MQSTPLGGCSILVVEEQPFVAHCLQMILAGAGAQVHSAGDSREALHLMDRTHLSAVVLHDGQSAKGHRRIAQRLARSAMPCVICKDHAGEDETWRGATVLFKPVLGIELVEALRRLIHAKQSEMGAGRLLHRPDSTSKPGIHFPRTAT